MTAIAFGCLVELWDPASDALVLRSVEHVKAGNYVAGFLGPVRISEMSVRFPDEGCLPRVRYMGLTCDTSQRVFSSGRWEDAGCVGSRAAMQACRGLVGMVLDCASLPPIVSVDGVACLAASNLADLPR